MCSRHQPENGADSVQQPLEPCTFRCAGEAGHDPPHYLWIDSETGDGRYPMPVSLDIPALAKAWEDYDNHRNEPIGDYEVEARILAALYRDRLAAGSTDG